MKKFKIKSSDEILETLLRWNHKQFCASVAAVHRKYGIKTPDFVEWAIKEGFAEWVDESEESTN